MSSRFETSHFLFDNGQRRIFKSSIKKEIDQLSKDLYNIDLQLQAIRQGQPNPHSTATLEQARVQIKNDLVAKEIQFQQLNARCRKVIGGYLFLRDP